MTEQRACANNTLHPTARDDKEQDERIVGALRQMDQIETLIFLGGVKAFAANRITFEDFERDVGRLVGKHRAGEEISVSDLPIEWSQPH